MQRPGGLEAREGEASGGTPDPSGATVRVPGGGGQGRRECPQPVLGVRWGQNEYPAS